MVLRIRSDSVYANRTDLRPAGDVLVELARESDVPLHRQIEASIRDGIRSGRLRRGTPLPPTPSPSQGSTPTAKPTAVAPTAKPSTPRPGVILTVAPTR